MLKPTVIIAVNGILTRPGNSHAWTDRAVTWFHQTSMARAEKFEYLALPLTRRLFQKSRAKNLALLVNSYAGSDIFLIGHSNGCDLICRALKQSSTPVRGVHLIAAATESDMGENGLNEALAMGRLGTVHVYRGMDDKALWFAHLTSKLLTPFGLGYGDLGRQGPENVADWSWSGSRLFVHDYPGFGHSDFFKDKIFITTMMTIRDAMLAELRAAQ